MVVHAAARARCQSRPAGHLVCSAAALGSLSLAILVHSYGQMTMFDFMVEEQCLSRGAGEFIDFHESLFPVSGALECTDRTIQLVPAWVNPAVSALLVAALVGALASFAANGRGNRAPATPRP